MREPYLERPDWGGVQRLYKFANGFGASVISHQFSLGGNQGKWELAVIEWDGDKYDVIFGTPVTDDVVGHLSEKEVDDLLARIEVLP